MLVLRDKGRSLFYPEKTGREEGAPIFGQFIDNKGIVQFESLQREEDILPFFFRYLQLKLPAYWEQSHKEEDYYRSSSFDTDFG